MFNWMKAKLNKLFGRKTEKELSLERGLADVAAGRITECKEFQGLDALTREGTRRLQRQMEKELFDPTYTITYSQIKPRRKKKTKKKKKVQAPKGKYGSQKKASSRKSTKPKTKGNKHGVSKSR